MTKKMWIIASIVAVTGVLFSIGIFLMHMKGEVPHGDNELAIGAVSKEIVIGALIQDSPLSDKILAVAQEDVNKRLTAARSDIRVKVITEDTKGDSEIAREKIKTLHEKGIHFAIGVESSAILFAIKEYANQNGIIMMSTASTAPSLQLEEDNLFRLVPSDEHQAAVLANRIAELKKKRVVTISREDVYGSDMHLEMGKALEAKGIDLQLDIRYRTDQKGFYEQLKIVRDYSPDVVQVTALSEVVNILSEASKDNHKSLRHVKWFGTDGVYSSSNLLRTPEAAEFALATSMEVTGLRVSDKNKESFGELARKVGTTVDDPEFTLFRANLYDAIKLIAESAMAQGPRIHQATVKDWKDQIPKTAASLEGVTGSLKLDEFGDRQYFSYGIYAIEKASAGTYSWRLVKSVDNSL